MRALAIGTFVLDGCAAIGFVAVMAFGDRAMTPLDAFILLTLVLGFFSALVFVILTDHGPGQVQDAASLLITGAAMFDRLPDHAKQDLRQHFPQVTTTAEAPADPAHHLALLSQPSVAVAISLEPSRVQ